LAGASLVCTLVAGLLFSPGAGAQSFIGAHSMVQLDSPYSFMQAMFAEAAGMHATAIRLDVAPSLVFSDPSDPPDFSGLDEVMGLAQRYHLRVVGDLFTIPSWIAACQTPTSDPTRCGTDDLSDYRSMISQIVAHADPVIRDWEIWNEPDSSIFFDGTPQQYAQMLRAAHDAIKAVDPQANVLLGGMSGVWATAWLAQVFATPGADAEHAFDIANIHERNRLGALAFDVASLREFLAADGFTGPLWVTEHGYPSDPAFQYDPAYTSGPASQAAFLTASIPTLFDAGADAVFVTERDNLSGQYASEGVLGGDVLDPPVADPQPIEKPAYAAVRAVADCYSTLARDCLGPPPAALPASVSIPATRLGSSGTSALSVSDPGPYPLELGAVVLPGPNVSSIAVQRDACSNQILEPGQTCTVALGYRPQTGGNVRTQIQVPSDDGTLDVPIQAVAPSVSSLASGQLIRRSFTATGAVNRFGRIRRFILRLRNPLSAPVHIATSSLRGRDRGEFAIRSNRCAHTQVAPGAGCRLSVFFTPRWRGMARAALVLRGDGTPLVIQLQARP
jgi:Cellulase (glycosyl hydrolase family 5)